MDGKRGRGEKEKQGCFMLKNLNNEKVKI